MPRRPPHERTSTPRSLPARWRPRHWLPAIALGAMALGVAGLLAVLPAVSNACQPVPDPARVSSSRMAAAVAPGSRVLIVGDSYTAGSGSTRSQHSWARDLVDARGWDAVIDAGPGTGYVNTGPMRASHLTFGSRIAQDATLHPDLVIVQGSQNDWVVPEPQLQAAAEATLDRARRQWPNAVVVAFGPSAPQPRAESTKGISDAVAAGARAAGVTYIDPLAEQWFTAMNSGSFATPDGQHLNDAGYRYLADKVGRALDRLAEPRPHEQCR
ncbi:SGNH/GDSL hydrolase family protein [Curtobacterium sp. ISL-83]|uniref:SGNH/GDSL hydrolase family protein n=1 Tax=Curtobacterium sp. ISL-83 TaxID=2819145 RepID=UPI001BE5198F|nr:SGNH/GDSL hydrolase family protein [Curtobacterium sp. ISL-83]MBT2501821.1 SGNH/GDSL hydrolase family protein [Curtobacterium sp. ISL-83]